jgi:hypothetical protein
MDNSREPRRIPGFPSSNPAAHVIISAASLAAVVKSWHALNKWMFDPYRPELHYMRGPGPKWRAKHAQVSARRDVRPIP